MCVCVCVYLLYPCTCIHVCVCICYIHAHIYVHKHTHTHAHTQIGYLVLHSNPHTRMSMHGYIHVFLFRRFLCIWQESSFCTHCTHTRTYKCTHRFLLWHTYCVHTFISSILAGALCVFSGNAVIAHTVHTPIKNTRTFLLRRAYHAHTCVCMLISSILAGAFCIPGGNVVFAHNTHTHTSVQMIHMFLSTRIHGCTFSYH